MEYAKDEIFSIKYNTRLNRLQMQDEKWTSKLLRKIRNNKLLTTAIIVFIMFCTLNFAMIYSFMKILQSI